MQGCSNTSLFAATALWVIAGGLLLQLWFIPVLLADLHWGHGLIGGLDWTVFHVVAEEQARRINADGWSVWELRPARQFPAGLASALYAVSYPEPWVVLPANGLFFATAVVAVRRVVVSIFGPPATLAVAPFFLFASFVPIWGQLHKDVSTGAGVAVVLLALVSATGRPGESRHLLRCMITAALGTALVWLARPYATVVTAVAALSYVAIVACTLRDRRWLSAAVVTATVMLAAVLLVAVDRSTTEPAVQVRAIGVASDSTTYPVCLPRPEPNDPLDGLLFALCGSREGFKLDGRDAGSNIDYDVRLRTLGELVAYTPRALKLALVEPLPSRWTQETTPLGRLATWFVPLEMLLAYSAFAGFLVLGYREARRPIVLAVLGYCIVNMIVFAYTVPNVGTLYRMRAFAFAILIATALAAVLCRSRPAAEA